MTSLERVGLYHAHHSLHPEDLPFWLEHARASPGPILELGCGSGRVLLPLTRAGYEVVGLDNDPEMLQFLRQSWPDELGEPPVVQADFTRFHLRRKFGLIILPCNTYSTLDEMDRRSLLDCVVNHLQPGGAFAVSMPNPSLLYDLPARGSEELEETFLHPGDGEPVQVSSGWRKTRTSLNLVWHYDHLLPDGEVQRLTWEVRHLLTRVETLLQEFADAGLPLLALYGNYDRSDYTAESPQLIVVAYSAD